MACCLIVARLGATVGPSTQHMNLHGALYLNEQRHGLDLATLPDLGLLVLRAQCGRLLLLSLTGEFAKEVPAADARMLSQKLLALCNGLRLGLNSSAAPSASSQFFPGNGLLVQIQSSHSNVTWFR